MLKKSKKYLIISAVNLIILTLLLLLWTDRFELFFNQFIRPFEFLKLIGITIVSLLIMPLLVLYFRKKEIITWRTKFRIMVFITFLVSSYFYFDYSTKILENVIINGKKRNTIANKIDWIDGHGTKARKLTRNEYQEIARISRFPKIPTEATNINYYFQYDDFFPEYYFSLQYDLPKEMKIDSFSYQNKDNFKYQTYRIVGEKIRISYGEENK